LHQEKRVTLLAQRLRWAFFFLKPISDQRELKSPFRRGQGLIFAMRKYTLLFILLKMKKVQPMLDFLAKMMFL
jgi:hypothetical protein